MMHKNSDNDTGVVAELYASYKRCMQFWHQHTCVHMQGPANESLAQNLALNSMCVCVNNAVNKCCKQTLSLNAIDISYK